MIAAVLVLGLVAVVVASFFGSEDFEDGSYLVIELQGHYAEGRPKGRLTRFIEDRQVFVELLSRIARASADDRIAGIMLRVGGLDMGWGQAREIRDALDAAKSEDKHVVAFLGTDVGGGNLEYYVASVADSVYIPAAGAPLLNGLSAQYLFLGGLWEKFDVAMEVEQVREYKTFGDTIGRRGMTTAHREMANSLLDDINHEFVHTIADSRSVSTGELAAIIDAGPASPSDFVEAGLADGVLFFDEIAVEIGGGARVPTVSESDYGKVDRFSFDLAATPKIAVIHAVGNIVSGDGSGGGAFGSTVGSETLSDAFRDAAADPEVRAIVFRVNSPGGSALASDQVWRSARLAREKKPVIASLGDVAASGGYYMASAADKIIAEPGTLTGSIGVVMFKPNVAGLLGRLGIGSETLGRGRYSRILDITKGMDRAEVALIRTQLDSVYRLFLDRVAVGRKMTAEEVDELGGGRVWTGRQALDQGLVDELGGLQDAVVAAADAVGIADPDDVRVIYLPQPKGVLDELGVFGRSQATRLFGGAVGSTLGELASMSALDAGVYALSAGILHIR